MRSNSFYNRNVLVYVGIIFVLLYFFFRFGIQAVVDIAFLITNKNPKTTTNVKKVAKKGSGIIMEPYFLDSPHATNTAQISLKGKGSPDNKIILLQQGKQTNETYADYDGNFEFFLDLKEKENNIQLQAVDPDSKKTLDSALYTISYIKESPKLEITKPTDGSKFYQQDLSIEGSTDKEVFVKVNGINVIVKADGTFVYPVTLNNGENSFKVEAFDIAGNVSTKEFKVTYVQ